MRRAGGVDWDLLLEQLLRHRCGSALVGLICMRQPHTAMSLLPAPSPTLSSTDVDGRPQPPFVLRELNPLSVAVRRRLEQLDTEAGRQATRLDRACGAAAPGVEAAGSSLSHRRAVGSACGALLRDVQQLVPVVRALLRRTRLYARLESRRGVADMELAVCGHAPRPETTHGTHGSGMSVEVDAAMQADARHVQALLRASLAVLAGRCYPRSHRHELTTNVDVELTTNVDVGRARPSCAQVGRWTCLNRARVAPSTMPPWRL